MTTIIVALLALGIVLIGLGLALLAGDGIWRDDGECRGMVWHTLRIPPNSERIELWHLRRPVDDDRRALLARIDNIFWRGQSDRMLEAVVTTIDKTKGDLQ